VRDGVVFEGGRCWRVVRLFEVCTPRREKVAQETARLYRNGKYLGDCVIKYELDPALCNLLTSI
jgi:hypothetical protein